MAKKKRKGEKAGLDDIPHDMVYATSDNPALHTRPLLTREGVASGPLRGATGRCYASPRGREHARTARD